ncbi:YgiT-type zinc finger domain-containing protein [Sporolactobacillus nakayamae]|uniref:YgiT-type zinc finger domain-containing protein n=1 Tax=Sporolactobacillus nakayamae TaxID=269670 RepID=A0A1I2SGG1_9BACL|nr:YgiT-type zinc finger domain-containing protein [Sporolactobacillus nakayamae]SFG49997.1 hypothetical protein SAMN02982927_01909 [Sporolactobacillus nakayamae]
MIVVEDQKVNRRETVCSCGERAKLRYGSRDFFIGPRKITVLNMPYYYCERCDEASFDSKWPVDKVLKFAYLNGLNKIDWNEKVLYI